MQEHILPFSNNDFLELKKRILKTNIRIPKVALYIHIPFCINKCSYCDFYSVKKNTAKKFLQKENLNSHASRFIQKILLDIKDLTSLFGVKEFSSVYIGGGTPSVLSIEDANFLVSTISKKITKNAEFTMELNPETVTTDFLETVILGGVNRFSLGVQTFSEDILKNCSRSTTCDDLVNAIHLLKIAEKKHGVKISCDLIAGFKNQTKKQMQQDVQNLINAEIKHISIYTLCTKNYQKDIENDFANTLFNVAVAELKNAGFIRYEVSNFAKSATHESFHNKAYWKLQDHFGVGPAATGTIVFKNTQNLKNFSPFAVRFSGFQNLDTWFEKRFPYSVEAISKLDCIKDFLLMGLRLKEGINKKSFYFLFNDHFDNLLKKTIKKFSSLISVNDKNTFALNNEGLNFVNEFLAEAFLELEKLSLLIYDKPIK